MDTGAQEPSQSSLFILPIACPSCAQDLQGDGQIQPVVTALCLAFYSELCPSSDLGHLAPSSVPASIACFFHPRGMDIVRSNLLVKSQNASIHVVIKTAAE